MKLFWRGVIAGVVLAVAAALVAAVVYLETTGLSARARPGSIETALAGRALGVAIPGDYRDRANPVAATPESIRVGLEHFADHCAVCHGNDGSGETEFGRGLFPPPPDLRIPDTQGASDGTLFYIIEHGIRFTGMPAFGTGTPEGEEESWHLVNFIRHLPDITEMELAEMAELNPQPPAEIRRQIEEERFLSGEDLQ